MGLYDSIKEDEAKLAELDKELYPDEDADTPDEDPVVNADTPDEDPVVDADTPDEDDKGEEDPVEEDKGEEDPESDKDEDPAEDGKGEEDPEDDKNKNNLAAQIRIMRKEKLKLQEELEAARRANTPQPPQNTPAPVTPSGDEAKGEETVEQRVARLEQEKYQTELRTQAQDELRQIESEYKKSNPEYGEAVKHLVGSMAAGVRAAYPTASQKDIANFMQDQLLRVAGDAHAKGLNPAEVLHNMAYERYGFDPAAKPETPGAKPTESKPDPAARLRKVSRNKKRAASAIGQGGQNTAPYATLQEAAKMPLGKFSKLTDAEIEKLMQQDA